MNDKKRSWEGRYDLEIGQGEDEEMGEQTRRQQSCALNVGLRLAAAGRSSKDLGPSQDRRGAVDRVGKVPPIRGRGMDTGTICSQAGLVGKALCQEGGQRGWN